MSFLVKIISIVSFFVLSSSVTFGLDFPAVTAKIKEVSAIQDSLLRLQQYDALAKQILSDQESASTDVTATAPDATPELLTSWKFDKHDSLEDNKTYYYFKSMSTTGNGSMLIIQYAVSKIPTLNRVNIYLPTTGIGFYGRNSSLLTPIYYRSDEAETSKLIRWPATPDGQNFTLVGNDKKQFFDYILSKDIISLEVHNPGNNAMVTPMNFEVHSLENCLIANGLSYGDFLKAIK